MNEGARLCAKDFVSDIKKSLMNSSLDILNIVLLLLLRWWILIDIQIYEILSNWCHSFDDFQTDNCECAHNDIDHLKVNRKK